uniref:Uncharacterized protein n=1 Tax=Cucumis melo TaxID=3656 RepID=A0A9I9EII5_CUCME
MADFDPLYTLLRRQSRHFPHEIRYPLVFLGFRDKSKICRVYVLEWLCFVVFLKLLTGNWVTYFQISKFITFKSSVESTDIIRGERCRRSHAVFRAKLASSSGGLGASRGHDGLRTVNLNAYVFYLLIVVANLTQEESR